MTFTTSKTLRVIAWGLAALVAIGTVFLIRLAYISKPSAATSLQFVGFVPLPKESTVSVLDYLTISDRNLFVTNESTGTVYKIALPQSGVPNAPIQKNSTSQPAAAHGVALDSSKEIAFVTRSEANSVDVFNVATMRDIARIPVSEDADAILYDAEHNFLYVAHGDAHSATLIDATTHAVAATIPLGGKPEFMALDPQSHRLYQNLNDLNLVAEVDVIARAVTQRWALVGCLQPSGMALDERSRRLFVACSGNATLAVFDLNSHRVTSVVSIGGKPDTVAFDPGLHRIYTTGRAGTLSVISQDGPDAYHRLENIDLHYGAHTLAVDPRTHYVYVGYASLITAPRIGVLKPKT